MRKAPNTARPPVPHGFEVALVLGGGNALGAYHLGVCERLLEAGIAPSRLFGTSIGAVTAAILAGNRPDAAIDRLRAFWNEAVQIGPPLLAAISGELRARFNNDFALTALVFGRPGIFGPRYPGPWSLLPGVPPDFAIRDHTPLAQTLERLIDFDRLNSPEAPHVSIAAIDMERGSEVWFDNRRDGIEPRHLLATTALAPLFPPVEIDGRLLCDAGFGNNLPLDRAFAGIERDTLCFAVEVYNPSHGRPASLDEMVARVQDIAFSMQTERAVNALARERALLRRCEPESPSAILAHLAYRAPGHQRALKPLDFSRASIDERIAQGREDSASLLDALAEAASDAPLFYLRFPPEEEPPASDPRPREGGR